MFSSKGLFKAVPCPGGLTCQLPDCIFFHDPKKEQHVRLPKQDVAVDVDAGGDRKRIKLSNGAAVASVSRTPPPRIPDPKKPFVGIITSRTSSSVNSSPANKSGTPSGLKSLARQITPPKTKAVYKKSGTDLKASSGLPADPSTATGPKEDLNPRLVGSGMNCASHNTRLALLKMLHTQMQRLDTATRSSSDPKTSSRGIHEQNLVKLALDEEQRVAKNHGSNYRVTMGHMMVAYRKMEVEGWIEILDSKTAPAEPPPPPSPFSDDLDSNLERTLLKRYIADSTGLKLQDHGYILETPTEEAIASTQTAMEKSDYWETCDRCGTRFQVFRDRREDGALTSGSVCKHHWGRAYRNKDTKEQTYTCCGAIRGSPGCSTHDTHVFNTKDKTRLAKALQFMHTPENHHANPDKAVSFDCEMGYTTLGMEMIRISATAWPSGKKLIDTLVRPIGHVLDLNTRFSGVTPDQFLDAKEYTPPLDGTFNQSLMPTNPEPILSSPAIARGLLFSFITPATPLIGHSIDNDLNVIRMIHPTIIDTVILFPHVQGLPYRLGLKRLTKDHLRKDIQTAGADGHDSLEDARATGDLVRAKMCQEWILLKSQGWKIDESERVKHFVAPDNWEEKGAGKGYLLVDKWWEVTVDVGDDETAEKRKATVERAEIRNRIRAALV